MQATRPPEKITSPANPLVKMLKSLHAKKGRSETGLFLAEGARLAAEASAARLWPAVMAVSGEAMTRPQVRALAESAAKAGARVIETSEALLSQISKRDNAQTVVCAYRQFSTPLTELRGDFFIALFGVRDPGNLGTILRTADCVGAAGVVLVGQTCDPFSVEAVRASMGSIFTMRMARAGLEELEPWRKAAGLTMIGASLRGAAGPDSIDATRKLILAMGNEQSGLSDTEEQACDRLVRLPMRGGADSLNLASATAVLAYDVWRRRGYDGA